MATDHRAQADAQVGPSDIQRCGKRRRMGRRLHQPHMTDQEHRRLGHAPHRHRRGQADGRVNRRHHCHHARNHERAEHHGRDQRVAIHGAPTQGVADQPDRTKAHQAPADQRAVEPGQAFKDVRQVGIGSEHAAEHQDRQEDMPLHHRTAQDLELRTQSDLLILRPGDRQVDKQQQRLGQGNHREHGKRCAPAEHVGNQGAHWNTEHRGADDAEANFFNGTPGEFRADNVHRRFAGQGPEHWQPQGGDQAGQGHHPDIGRQCCHGIGRREHDQNAYEQALALEPRAVRGQERAERRHGKREQRHQQPGLGHTDIQVPGDRRQQANDDEFCGQHGKTGSRQQQDREQHGNSRNDDINDSPKGPLTERKDERGES